MTNTPALLRLGDGDNDPSFNLQTMQSIEDHRKAGIDVPHRHEYYVIMWVIRGTGGHEIDLVNFPVEDNSLFIIHPGQVHRLTVSSPVEGFVLSFTHEFTDLQESALAKLPSGKQEPVREADQPQIRTLFNDMLREFGGSLPLRNEALRGYLKVLLVMLMRQLKPATRTDVLPKNMELTDHFMQLLEKGFLRKHQVGDYAAELVVTPGYLNEVVKKVTGLPASYHIRHRIILEAKRQAAYTCVNMKEIGYHLGFADGAHFSKFFRSVTGISFSQFRKGLSTQP